MIYTIIFLLVVFLFIYLKNKKYKNSDNFNKIWLYWENENNSVKPEYLNLCYKTVLKNCSKNFKIHLLNEKTVYDYLPELRKDINKKLLLPQKTDYIRYNLLYNYGGIWLDSDIIVLNDLSIIIDKLNKYDFVGFGSNSTNTKNGYPYPSVWAFAAQKNTTLMKNCIDNCDKYLDLYNESYLKSNYHIFGRLNLWKNIKLLLEKNWKYYHFDST